MIGNKAHAQRPLSQKRALRGRTAPLQAHDRKNRPPDRASRPRVLRKADIRTQTEEGRGDQTPLQTIAQSAVAAEALLNAPFNTTPRGESNRPFLLLETNRCHSNRASPTT